MTDDPVLTDVKLIAEPWDAVNTDLTGAFYPNSRWSEWNGHYRDTVQQHHSGDTRVQKEFEQCLAGSPHIYPHPEDSINFVTCHDGFTLRDLVTYSEKHNLSNGEENADGCNANFAWNCGTEGPTDDPTINALRQQQIEKFIHTLLTSRGIPLIRMGDEYGHTAHGNNNPWCQDNPLNWFLWDQLEKNQTLFFLFKKLIKAR